jgi:hypothetical protein
MISVMIDTETMSTAANAVILTLGAVKFNAASLDDPYDPFYIKLDVDQQLELGRHVDDGTMTWWSKQGAHVQEEAFSEEGRLGLDKCIDGLAKYLVGADEIWAQGPVFDIAILENLLHQMRRPTPWQFWQIRDSRTLFSLGWDPRKEIGQQDLHNALADAYTQAQAVQKVFYKFKFRQPG